MTARPLRRVACLLVALLPFALAAGEIYTMRGTVTAPLRDGLLTVAHEDVPGLMPAMTMPFRVEVADRPAAAALATGDRIEFQFAVGDTSRAYDFRRIGRVAAPPTGPTGTVRRLREGDAMAPFSLRDQDGQPVSADDLRGRWTALTFIFTRCPVPEFCPRMSQQFSDLQRRIKVAPPSGPAVQLLSISFDPAHDTPEVLRAYGERYAADAAVWRLCTGTEPDIRALLQRFAVHVEPNQATLDHTLATALIDPDGRVRQIWRGNQWSADDVLAAIAAPSPTPR